MADTRKTRRQFMPTAAIGLLAAPTVISAQQQDLSPVDRNIASFEVPLVS